MEQIYIPKQDYKVLVRCFTYNQSKYIEDALNGFAIQKTNFPFVCMIMDDCSTDGEQEVIKAWMELECDMEKAEFVEIELSNIILVPHKTNINCSFAFYLLKRNTWKERPLKIAMFASWRDHCEYEATCEGDDYWTYPHKLQKMYDVLEANPQYSTCHHDYKVRKGDTITDRNATVKEVMNILDIARGGHAQTATMLFRLYDEPLVPSDFPFRYPVYQYFWLMRLAEKGDIYYFDEPWSVYRVNEGGIFSMQSPLKQYQMSAGNLINMIDWYTQRVSRPDVVCVIKKRALSLTKAHFLGAVKHLRIKDALQIARWGLQILLNK